MGLFKPFLAFLGCASVFAVLFREGEGGKRELVLMVEVFRGRRKGEKDRVSYLGWEGAY